MSRIGKNPVIIPAGVEVNLKDGHVLEFKGPKGTIEEAIHPDMKITIENGEILVERPSENKKHKSLHGMTRTKIFNHVEGVLNGYSKQLEITGTGYRAEKAGKSLNLNLGFSHPVTLEDPEGIEVEVPNNTTIIVRGADKQAVGAHAAKIRSYREPEPYKGKGIRYTDEHIIRKVGKTGS
ncbi:MAG: 50S ribosomal protein L6 [Tissierellia bacterium]|nr:50S ribosomal protein L6 [Tissierellia bacterium]